MLIGSGIVRACALLHDQLFVTRDVARVFVHDTKSFQLQRQLTFPGLGSCLPGLATCATNTYLYIADCSTHRVHRIDLSIAGARTKITWTVTNPRGLSVNRARNIFIAMEDFNKVQEYMPTGSLITEISDSFHLWQAVELSSDIFAVSQSARSCSTRCIHCVSNRK